MRYQEALNDAGAGGLAGLAVLFGVHHPPLLRYLRALDPRGADDHAAATWLDVASHMAGFDGDQADFAALVFTIARARIGAGPRRQLRDDIRARSRPNEAEEDPISRDVHPQHAVNLVVRLLGPDDAEVVLLRAVGGLSPRHVAGVLGRNEQWVRDTLDRGMRRLGELLPP